MINDSIYPDFVKAAVYTAIRKIKVGVTDQDAEDMLQEAWARVLFRAGDKPESYQFVTAHRAALDYFFKFILEKRRPFGSKHFVKRHTSLENWRSETGEDNFPAPPQIPQHANSLPISEDALVTLLASTRASYTNPRYRGIITRGARRHARIIVLLAHGYNENGIARELNTTTHTIRSSRSKIRRALTGVLNAQKSPRPAPQREPGYSLTSDWRSQPMSNTILHSNATNGKIQTGPVYHCPECSAVVRRLIPYRDIISPGGHLDTWGDHIAYLDLPTACKKALHPARVAVFGAAAVPLIFPGDHSKHHHVTTEECVALLQQAIAQIVREVGPQKPVHDPAASIVYRLVTGILAPKAAIAEIRELAHFGALNALQVPEPELAFQEAAR